MTNTTFKKSLYNKFVFLSIVPLIIFSLIFLYFVYSQKIYSLTVEHNNLISNIDFRLNKFYNDIDDIAKLINEHTQQYDIILLNNIISIKKEINSIIVLDTNGKVKEYLSKKKIDIFKGYDYSSKPIFQKFKQNNKNFLSNVYYSSATNEPLISYIFHTKDNIYILELNLNFLKEYITNISNTSIPKGTNSNRIVVIDKHGRFIVDTYNELNIKNKKSFYDTTIYHNAVKSHKEHQLITFYDENQQRYNFLTFAVQTNTKWTLIVQEENNAIYQNIMRNFYILIIFLAIMVIITLFVSNSMTNSIVLPIEYLVNEILSLSKQTHEKSTIKPIKTYPLFQKLINTFNEMKYTIIKREKELTKLNDNLEHEVHQKTNELNKLNQSLEIKVQQEIIKNKEKEKILFEQSKMAAMGEMIGNIAHQWRQPLSLISTAASGIELEKEYNMLTDEKLYKATQSILQATTYLSTTIDDFRNFFKSSKNITEFSIQDIINKDLTLMSSSFKDNNIDIIVNNKDQNIKIFGYENELIQAILNILNNAKDALKDNVQNPHKRFIFIEYKIENFHLHLTITDNGGGIMPNIIDKIFEPYFTTKHKSQGTGIGLYMTREIIVTNMNGTINVVNTSYEYENTQYYGAKFTIIIPTQIDGHKKRPA